MKVNKNLEKFAVTNLTFYLIVGYGFGYLFQLFDTFRGSHIISYLTLDAWKIIHGQIWRLISWVIIPPSDYTSISGFFFILLMMWCCLSIGTTLERTWGTVKYNMFIFGGILFTIISAFVCLALFCFGSKMYGGLSYDEMMSIMALDIVPWNTFSTYYINMSIYILFALTYPDMGVRLFFIIPVKMKWLGIIDGLYFAYYLIIGLIISFGFNISSMAGNLLVAAVLASLLNILFFWLMFIRRGKGISLKQKKRQAEFRSAYNSGASSYRTDTSGRFSGTQNRQERHEDNSQQKMRGTSGVTRHKCAICGRTEMTNPELEFRFCSKCNGNYEYCSDHLFSHLHK